MSDTYDNIEVELTPAKYLTSEQRYIRAQLINNKITESEHKLEILHDKFNEHDSLALEVYTNQIFIGYILKNSPSIDSFCFNNDNLLRDISIIWDDVFEYFQISRKITDEVKMDKDIQILEDFEEEMKAKEIQAEVEDKNIQQRLVEAFKNKLFYMVEEMQIYEESDFNFLTKVSRSEEYAEMKRLQFYMFTLNKMPYGKIDLEAQIIENLFDEYFMPDIEEIFEEMLGELKDNEKLLFLEAFQ